MPKCFYMLYIILPSQQPAASVQYYPCFKVEPIETQKDPESFNNAPTGEELPDKSACPKLEVLRLGTLCQGHYCLSSANNYRDHHKYYNIRLHHSEIRNGELGSLFYPQWEAPQTFGYMEVVLALVRLRW